MFITDLSRKRGISSSCYLIELGSFVLVVDSGLDPKVDGLMGTPQFDLIEGREVDLVLLTHCHLDHLGSLPLLLRQQPGATVLSTKASTILAPRMLRNSVNVMMRQREELHLPEYPLYSFSEIDYLEGRLFSMPFGHERTFEKGGETLEITFFCSGHVAGAAGIRLVYRKRIIFITGDVLFENQMTIPGAEFPRERAHVLVTETTRGAMARGAGRERSLEVSRLINTLRQTLLSGGSCIIPVFALGRMQEVMALLREALIRGVLPKVPVFCSGLGLDLVDYFDTISRKASHVNFRRSIAKDLGVQKLSADLKPGKDLQPKGIYLLSSGMMVEHTPSYSAVAAALSKSHNSISFVGYCDPDSPAGKLLSQKQHEPFLFEKIGYESAINAALDRFDLSGHADREELLDFALELAPDSIVLCHGDPPARDWFFDSLVERIPNIRVTDPEPGVRYEV